MRLTTTVCISLLAVGGPAARATETALVAMPADTVGCRAAAKAAVRLWFHAVSNGDTVAVRRAISPNFAVISAGRNGWPEPFRATQIRELISYVLRRSAKHERIADLAVPTGGWSNGRLGLGVIGYTRTADDVRGRERWLGQGEYQCGRGIFLLGSAPQGLPPK